MTTKNYKNILFCVFIAIFIATAIITLLGVIGAITIQENYLDALFTSLLIELIGSVIALFKTANFFGASTNSTDVRLIHDPSSVENWDCFQEIISAFNAPWILANNSLYPAFKKFLQQEGFKLKILVFEGHSEQQKTEYMQRLKRIKILIDRLKIDQVNNLETKQPPAKARWV